MPLDVERCRGILPRGGTILGLVAHQPVQDRGRRRAGQGDARPPSASTPLVAIGGEDTLGVAHKLVRRGRARRRRPQDHRQRPRRPPRSPSASTPRCRSRRRHRPAAHDGRVPRPGARVRGDGPPRRLDRHLRRHRRRRRRGPGARGGVRHRGGVRRPQAPPREGPLRLDRRRRRGRQAQGGHDGARSRARSDAFGHVRLGGIGQLLAEADREAHRVRDPGDVLGHIQRGGTPTAFDRVLATRFGVAAIDAVHDGAFGQMVALQAGEHRAGAAGRGRHRAEDGRPRPVPDVAEAFFG